MLSKSAKHNPNYLATIVRLGDPIKHPKADRLQIFMINGCRVVTDLSRVKGDVGVFFPIESRLNHELISGLNMYQDANLNKDVTKKGYINTKGRVKAVRLREEPSMGLFLTTDEVGSILGDAMGKVGDEFDMWNDKLICQKYVATKAQGSGPKQEKGRKAVKISRLVENQFRLHDKTTNLRNNIHKLSPSDIISITKKLHGTSWVVGNVMVKKPLSLWQKVLRWFGAKLEEKEYDIIYSSRNVVQNAFTNSQSNPYYGVNVYADIMEVLKEKIPVGFTLYGEAVGYTSNGRAIQKNYDYGYKVPLFAETYKEGLHFGIYVYRITFTNINGQKYELSWGQIKQYCQYWGLKTVPELFYGPAQDWGFPQEHWHENLLSKLESSFLERDCTICVNKVPDEGIVVSKDGLYDFEAYKLKSFRFLEHETKMLDEGEENIEDAQEEEVIEA